MIVAKNLTKTFGRQNALKNLSFVINEGERVAVVGRNGAGKTTLLRVMSTFFQATSGSMTVNGLDIVCDALALRSICGYLPENAPLYEDMRVAEYLRFRCKLRGMRSSVRRRQMRKLLTACDLAQHANSEIGTLSRGIRRRVAIADATIHEPSVLLFDDPFAGCDPCQKDSLVRLVKSIRRSEKKILVFTSHDRDVIASLATRIICLHNGEIISDTTDMSCLESTGLPELLDTWINEKTKKREIPEENSVRRHIDESIGGEK